MTQSHAIFVYGVVNKQLVEPTKPVRNPMATGEKRAQAHDYDAPNHHEKRR